MADAIVDPPVPEPVVLIDPIEDESPPEITYRVCDGATWNGVCWEGGDPGW